jgi:hypothetical protein
MIYHRAWIIGWTIVSLAMFVVAFILCVQRINVSQFFLIYGILASVLTVAITFLMPRYSCFAIYNLHHQAFTSTCLSTHPIKLQCFEVLVPISYADYRIFHSNTEIQNKYRRMVQ